MDTEASPAFADLRYWKRRLPDPTFVYVMQGDPGTPIKIGFAKNPFRRMATLQTGYPWDLRLIYVYPAPKALETRLHIDLKAGRLRGEWFDGPTVEAWLPFLADLAASFRKAGALGGTTPPWDLHYWDLRARHGLGKRPPDPRSTDVTVRQVEPFPLSPGEREAFEAERAREADIERQRRDRIRRADPHLA